MGENSAQAKPLFLGSFEFETEESPLSLTFWQGDKTYQFMTNFIGLYPMRQRKVAKSEEALQTFQSPLIRNANSLEEKLVGAGLRKAERFDVKQDEFASRISSPRVVQFLMDKRTFSGLDKTMRENFNTAHKQDVLWEIGYLRKAEFEPWLNELLLEKNRLDKAFKGIYDSMLGRNRLLFKPEEEDIADLINERYLADGFDAQITFRAFKEMGYDLKASSIENILHIFKETRYSLENPYHLINADNKIFGPLGIERKHPHPKDPDAIKSKYFSKIITQPFHQRFFDNCKIAFGKKGIRGECGRQPDADYIRKDEQEYVIDRLKELLKAREKYLGDSEYSDHIKYQLEELFSRIKDLNAESMTRKELKKLLDGRPGDGITKIHSGEIKRIAQLKSSKTNLEAQIKALNQANRLSYDLENRRLLLFLDILRRDKRGVLGIDGVGFGELLSVEELLSTPIALFDIEKFQYGSIKEMVSGCATIIRDCDGNYRQRLDFIRPTSKQIIKGFEVKTHNFSKELIKSIADFINDSGAFLNITYGSYDWEHLGKSKVFKLGQSKEAIPRRRVHIKFVERYEPVGSALNLLGYMTAALPQFINHRLSTTINHLYRRVGSRKEFKKSMEHEELRTADKKAELGFKSGNERLIRQAIGISDELGEYTVNDVKELMHVMLHPKSRFLFEDLLDIARTFGITMDQAASNPRTAAHIIDKEFFYQHGGFLDRGHFYQKLQTEYKSVRSAYSALKVDQLLKQGLKIDFERGLKNEVSMFYFAPELLISQAFYLHYPALEGYVNRTLSMKDDTERQVARLQYLKPFVMSMLTELSLLNKTEQKLQDLRNQGKDPAIIKENESLITWKKLFFERLFGITPDKAKIIISSSYAIAADVLNIKKIKPLQIHGNFIYAEEQGKLPQAELEKAGLFRVRRGMTIYNMSHNKLTYRFQNQFLGFPARLDRPTYRYSQFELNVLSNVLDNIFSGDFIGALKIINTSAAKLSSLEAILANPKKQGNVEFIQNLLTYNRTRSRYVGVVKGKEVEFTSDGRHAFKPDLDHYLSCFREKFFGLTKSDIDVDAVLPKLISGFIDLGDDNKPASKKKHAKMREGYMNLVSGTFQPGDYSESLLREAESQNLPSPCQGTLF
ncbi:MAG: hypothetical protein V1866_06335 [archaeon]